MAWSRVLCFTDPLACQAAFPYSDIEVLPTTKDFRIEMTQVAMSRLWLQRIHLSSPTVSTSTSKPGRRSIGFLTESNLSPYHHCGIEVMPGDIIVNTLEAEHRRCDPVLDYGSMSIPTDELDTVVEAIIGCEVMETSERHIFHPHPQLMSRLLRLHRAIGQLAHDTPDILQLPEVLRALENEFVHVMVRCLADAPTTRPALVADAMMRSSRGSKSFWRQIPTGRFISPKSVQLSGSRSERFAPPAKSIWAWDRSVSSPCGECTSCIARCCTRTPRIQLSPALSRITAFGSSGGFLARIARCSGSRRRRHCGVPRSRLESSSIVRHRCRQRTKAHELTIGD